MNQETKDKLLSMTGKEFFLTVGKKYKNKEINLKQYQALWKWYNENRESKRIDNFFYKD